jgi:hypothetical protein
MTWVGPSNGIDVGRAQGSDRDDRDPLFIGGHGLARQSRAQGAHDGVAAETAVVRQVVGYHRYDSASELLLVKKISNCSPS